LVTTCGDASTAVTYVQAWEYWASGRPDNGCLMLWGMSLRWWGRIGQLVAFTGSLFVVSELVDLPSIAESFRDVRSTFRRAATVVWQLRQKIVTIIVATLIVVGVVYLEVIRPFFEVRGIAQCMDSAGDFEKCVLTELWHNLKFLVALVALMVGGVGFILLFVFIVGYVIPNFIIVPLIWVLRILPRWAKALNLLLIIVAFHFNLLAS
jgi:hypothetical protein